MSSESESSAPDERPQRSADSGAGDRGQRESDPRRDGSRAPDSGQRKPYTRDNRAGERKPDNRASERKRYNRDGRDGEHKPDSRGNRDGQRKPYRAGAAGSSGASTQRSGDGSRGERGSRPPRNHGARQDRVPAGSGRDARPSRPSRERVDRPPEPALPEDVSWDQLDRDARARLRTLSKTNAELVGAHLVMAGRLLEEDPQLAYEHAQAAVRRAGRVDVVREAAALTAYATGRYAEALRELRTVRRLSAVDAHRAIEADCERGLGRPDRALALIADAPADLPADDQVELAIVASGARLDLGEQEAALSVLERADRPGLSEPTRERLAEATQAVLVALGRVDDDVQPAEADASADGGELDEDVIDIDDVLDGR